MLTDKDQVYVLDKMISRSGILVELSGREERLLIKTSDDY